MVFVPIFGFINVSCKFLSDYPVFWEKAGLIVFWFKLIEGALLTNFLSDLG